MKTHPLHLLLLFIWIFVGTSASHTGQFLHLSDIHYDQFYTPGSPTQCLFGSTGMGCCRKASIPLKPPGKASPWGDMNCDSPFTLLTATMQWIKTNLKYDFVIYTGDSASHWDIHQGWDINFSAIKTVTHLLQTLDKPVFNVIGNHDSFFVDQLYINYPVVTDIAKLWENNYFTNHANVTHFNQGGYYKTAYKKVPICVLNSLWYDVHNLAVILNKNRTDLGNQYTWAKQHLKDCVLLTHIYPTAGEATPTFNEFITDTQTQPYQFYGHSHSDQFIIVNDSQGNLRVGFIPLSVVPTQHYPGVRTYQYTIPTNSTDLTILDYTQYWLNLTHQIQNPTTFIGYKKSYSARHAYDLPDFSPKSWWNLALRMQTNHTLFQTYCNHFNPPHMNCSSTITKKNLLCNINRFFC